MIGRPTCQGPGDADERYIPLTSPNLTGSLHTIDQSSSLMRGLLDFPNVLRFSRITTLSG